VKVEGRDEAREGLRAPLEDALDPPEDDAPLDDEALEPPEDVEPPLDDVAPSLEHARTAATESDSEPSTRAWSFFMPDWNGTSD